MATKDKIEVGDLVMWRPKTKIPGLLREYYIALVIDHVEHGHILGDLKVLMHGRVCFWNSNVCEVINEN